MVLFMDGKGARRGGDEFRYPILVPSKKFIFIPIPKPNKYQTFVSFLSPPGNEFILILILVPTFLLFQY